MKVAVLNVGLIRPSVSRTIKNSINTQNLLISKYPSYSFTHYSFYYPDLVLGKKFQDEGEKNNLKCVQLPLAEEKTYTQGYTLFDNTYKCWKNLENSFNLIPNILEYDFIIRNRLDFEILDLIIPPLVKENNIYAQQLNSWSIFDNFSILTPSTYNKIYNIDIVDKLFLMAQEKKIKIENNEQLLQYICFVNNIQCKNIKFNIQGYQSKDKYWNGSPQWSKRNRNFNFII